MEEISISAKTREEKGTRANKRLREQILTPAVVYGKMKPHLILLNKENLHKLVKAHFGENIIFKMNIEEDGKKSKSYPVLIKEVQVNPVTDQVQHIDFLHIDLKEKITVKVPIELKGEPEGVVKENGTLDQHIRELDVECLPTDIPEKIEFKVEQMQIGDAIHVKDVHLSGDAAVVNDPEDIICMVSAHVEEVIEVPEEAAEAEGAAEAEAEEAKPKEGAPEEAKPEKGAAKEEGKGQGSEEEKRG